MPSWCSRCRERAGPIEYLLSVLHPISHDHHSGLSFSHLNLCNGNISYLVCRLILLEQFLINCPLLISYCRQKSVHISYLASQALHNQVVINRSTLGPVICLNIPFVPDNTNVSLLPVCAPYPLSTCTFWLLLFPLPGMTLLYL